MLALFINLNGSYSGNATVCLGVRDMGQEKSSAIATQYHSLPSNKIKIISIDDRDKYNEMLKCLAAESIVAIDAEWKPISRAAIDVALIQISTRDRIYLIDVMRLNMDVNNWNRLAEKVFNNQQLVKISKSNSRGLKDSDRINRHLMTYFLAVFAPMVDLQMFQRIMPVLSSSLEMKTSYLDLQVLWKELLKVPQFKFPYQGNYRALQRKAFN